MAAIYAGQRVLVECEFRLRGVATDPQVVRCLAKSPSGGTAILTYPDEDFIKRSDGRFEAGVEVTEPGIWHFRGEGAGIVDAVQEISLEVLASNF